MSAALPPRPATYADLETVPSHKVAEIIDGELIVSPRPAPAHAHAASVLAIDVGGPFHGKRGRGPGGWWILFEPELHLESHVVVPDLAGWRHERMNLLPQTAFFEVVPDWVCEVTSPSTAGLDRVRKLNLYAEQGLAYLWLLDPIGRTLEVYRLEGKHFVVLATHERDETVRAEPFDAVELDLTRFWPPLA